jgi:SAM-dependent methyltransferase
VTATQDFVRQLASVEFTRATPEVQRHLLTLFADDSINLQDLARPVASILLRTDDADELLHAYLRNCINVSYALEQRFIAMQRAPSSTRLAVSLAIQAFLNGYVWGEPLTSDAGLRDDPEYADLVRIRFDEPREERRLAATIANPRLVHDPVTAAVRAQYEEHPYPRWLTLHRPEPSPDTTPRRALVAGCGTGLSAIRLAFHHPAWSIDALDISLPSLGYAMRKANELGVQNIRFLHADLRDVSETYDHIESVGVLHHLPDPTAGLRALRNQLAPGGEMVVGVYSKRARASLARLGELAGDGSDIRRARARLLSSLDENEIAEVEDLDFFELGHFRDTLYHAHEIELTPLDLDAMIRAAGLRFLGFEGHGDERDLRVWDKIEQQQPDLFRHLFVMRLTSTP